MLGLHEGPHCGRRKQKAEGFVPDLPLIRNQSWTVSEMIKPQPLHSKDEETKKTKKNKKKTKLHLNKSCRTIKSK